MKFTRGAPPTRTQWFRWMGALGIVGGMILAAYALDIMLCPLRRWTGVPCPMCGSTRTVMALLSGRFADAFRINPLAAVAALGGAAVFAVESFCVFFKCRAPRLVLSRMEQKIAIASLVFLLMAQWVLTLAWQIFTRAPKN